MANLKIGFRWFGQKNDPISLAEIRQIPQTKQVENVGLKLEVIESVNRHDDIKIGLPSRDQYIVNYIQTIKNLSKVGIKVICYNFMPVFD